MARHGRSGRPATAVLLWRCCVGLATCFAVRSALQQQLRFYYDEGYDDGTITTSGAVVRRSLSSTAASAIGPWLYRGAQSHSESVTAGPAAAVGIGEAAVSAVWPSIGKVVDNDAVASSERTGNFVNHTSSSLQSQPQSPPWAIFYNIYFPEEETAGTAPTYQHPIDIVYEQLGQVAGSYAAYDGDSSSSTATIYYNTIGSRQDALSIPRICSTLRLNCVHMEHYPSGVFEEVTLERVQGYCARNPDNRVIYMHSKGSYHESKGKNHWWRRHMTDAVTHRDCLAPPDQSCNLCGLLFTPLPWLHHSGNFFTAQCDYINRLLPVREFQDRMQTLSKETRRRVYNTKQFTLNMLPDDDAYLGLGRFAMEHFPASHPSVVPCDMSKQHRKIEYWMTERNTSDEMEFTMFPSYNSNQGARLFPIKVRWKKFLRIREYFLLAGHVYKWVRVYNATPPPDSWVWGYFPEGRVWRIAIERYGLEHVVDKVVEPYVGVTE